MDLEKLKKEWQNRKLEGYLFEKPIDVIIADVKKMVQKRNRKYWLINFAYIGLGVVIAAAAIIAIYLEHALLVRVATLILMTTNFCELLWILKWRVKEHTKPYHLPSKQFDLMERDLMDKKLREIRRHLPLSGIAGFGALIFVVLCIIIDLATGEAILDFLIFFSVPLLIAQFTALCSMKADLSIWLQSINREIKQFDEYITSTSEID
jgi:hypothetical protein